MDSDVDVAVPAMCCSIINHDRVIRSLTDLSCTESFITSRNVRLRFEITTKKHFDIFAM